MTRQRRVFLLLAIFIITYVAVTFGVPPDPETLERYNLTATRMRFLSLTIAIPLVAIWYAAFYGFAKFKDYAELIKQSADGQAFTKIANGLMVLAIGLPLNSITSAVLRYAGRSNPDVQAVTAIINNYLNIIIALTAFVLIGAGARLLLGLNNKKPPLPHALALSLGFLIMGSFYAYLLLEAAASHQHAAAENAIHDLPRWLVMTTVIIPYLYIWYTGMISAFYIDFYRKNIGGLLYRRALKFLAWGVGSVIISSIALQYLTALDIAATLSLRALLVIVYVLLIIISVGYIFIAMGAKRLKQLEEV